jgi:Flp pilus assembly protein TadD
MRRMPKSGVSVPCAWVVVLAAGGASEPSTHAQDGAGPAAGAALRQVQFIDHPSVPVIQRLVLSSQFAEAEVVARAALRERTECARVRFLLGVAVQKQKRYGEARELLDAAQSSGQPFPEAGQVDHFLGWANYYLGELTLAKRHFQSHVGRVPTADDSWFGLGAVAIEENRLGDAETALQRALDLAGDGLPGRPMRAKALVRLGDVALLRDRFADAVELYEDALSLRPDQHEVWSKLARAYERAERPKDAAAAHDRAARLIAAPDAPSAGESPGPQQAAPSPPDQGADPKPAPSHRIALEDVTAGSGIDFVTTSGAMPPTQIIEVKGGGVALIDFDGDGDLDLFFPNGATLGSPSEGPGARLYENLGQMKFRRVDPDPPLRAWAFGPAVGDFDGDGRDDIAVACHGSIRLLLNAGRGTFVDASDRLPDAARDPSAWNTSVAAGDFDADGRLDLYITRYLRIDPSAPPGPSLFKGVPVMSGPRGLDAQGDVLLRNVGEARFEDVTEPSGIAQLAPAYGLNAAVADFTGDGKPDILVANDSQPDMLLKNLGGMRFEEIGRRMGIATSMEGTEQASMGIAIGDTNGDGLPDAHVTVFSSDTNTMHESRDGRFFDDRTGPRGTGIPSRRLCGWATAFIDLDHDGDEDLLTVNGHVYPQATLAMMDSEWAQPILVLERTGDRFEPVEPDRLGPTIGGSYRDRSAVFADLDGDGDIDMVITGLNQPVRVIRNGHNRPDDWIAISLDDPLMRGNRAAIGARIGLSGTGISQFRWLAGGGPFQSNRPTEAHFGIGTSKGPWTATVTWPDGSATAHEIDRPGRHRIVRPTAAD